MPRMNHYEGKMERQKGQGAGLMRWKKSTWRALVLSPAEQTERQGHRQERADLTYTAPTAAGGK